MSEDVVRFMDFSSSPEPVRFKVDDDIFEAYRVLSISSLQGAVKVMKGLSSLDLEKPDDKNIDETLMKMEKFVDVFDEMLLEESAARFKARALGKDNPIGLKQIINIIQWLLEVYGFRPTQQSSNSSDGSESDDTGTDSTDGAQPAESTQSS